MSLFSKLFGGGSRPEPEPEEYKGFRIVAEPKAGQGGYRLGARIEKEVGGEIKVHHMVRADMIQGAEEAATFSILKAKQLIDEQDEALFS